MNEIKGRRGGNIRNKRTHHPAKKRRQEAAKVRQAAYDKLTLDEKVERQEAFQGKQYMKLVSKLRKEVEI